MVVRSLCITKTTPNTKVIGLPTRKEFEAHLFKHLKYYTAARFLGRGKYEKYRSSNLDDLKKYVSETGLPGQHWMLYAVCDYCGVDHSIHLENLVL